VSAFCELCQSTGCPHAQREYDLMIRDFFRKKGPPPPEILAEVNAIKGHFSERCSFIGPPVGEKWRGHSCEDTSFICGRCGHRGMEEKVVDSIGSTILCPYCGCESEIATTSAWEPGTVLPPPTPIPRPDAMAVLVYYVRQRMRWLHAIYEFAEAPPPSPTPPTTPPPSP
jgi:hypothetical protein